MWCTDLKHRGDEGDRECHRLYCTYVHYSSKMFFVQGKHKVRRLLELQPCWLLLPSLPLQGLEAGKASSVRVPATGPPGALWCVSGTAPPTTRHPRSPSASAGRGWRGSQQRSSALALGPTAQAGLCPRPGTLACVSARDATPPRRHPPWTGEPEAPAPSATLCRP